MNVRQSPTYHPYYEWYRVVNSTFQNKSEIIQDGVRSDLAVTGFFKRPVD